MKILKCWAIIANFFCFLGIFAASDGCFLPIVIHHQEFVAWCKTQGCNVQKAVQDSMSSGNFDSINFLVTTDLPGLCGGECNDNPTDLFNNLLDHLGIELNDADEECREANIFQALRPQHEKFLFPVTCKLSETCCHRWVEKVRAGLHGVLCNFFRDYRNMSLSKRCSKAYGDSMPFYFVIKFDLANERLLIQYAPWEDYDRPTQEVEAVIPEGNQWEEKFDTYGTLPLALIAFFGGLSLVDAIAHYAIKF